jgi:hypothetical protein
MSQRDSGYARKANDFYATPSWVTKALVPFIPKRINRVWECACGDGQMVKPLKESGFDVIPTDIDNSGWDFLAMPAWANPFDAIITNPPFDLATQFIEQALRFTEPNAGFVAMLLRTDFDHAKSRTHLFRDSPVFSCKVALLKRIVWFVEDDGKPKASPSFNHAWYVWDWKHEGPPTIAYGP